MKKANKGYTLVELLLSIAIFAIVMVGITSILSGTMSAYSKANLDVTVQEDCQIVANQLEEILCDAYEISGTSLAAGLTVKTKNTVRDDTGALVTNNNTYLINYVAPVAPATGTPIYVTLNGGAPYVLADNVSNFQLSGWIPTAPNANYSGAVDNRTTIKLSMDVNGSTYSVNRAVYFRNNVETNKFNDIQFLITSTPGPSPSGDPTVKTVDIKRYETINLSADYGIKYGAALYAWDGTNLTPDSTASTYFTLTKQANFPGIVYPAGYDVESNTKPVSVFVKTGATINGNFGNPLAGNQFAVSGYTDPSMSASSKMTVVFTVKPVAINDTVIQAHKNGTVNNEGFNSPVTVDGIDINEAIKAGVTVITKFEVMNGGSVDTAFDEKTLTAVSEIAKVDDYKNNKSSGSQITVGVAPDPYSGGLFVLFNNEGMQHLGDSGNMKFNLHLTIGSTTLNKEFKLDRLDTQL